MGRYYWILIFLPFWTFAQFPSNIDVEGTDKLMSGRLLISTVTNVNPTTWTIVGTFTDYQSLYNVDSVSVGDLVKSDQGYTYYISVINSRSLVTRSINFNAVSVNHTTAPRANTAGSIYSKRWVYEPQVNGTPQNLITDQDQTFKRKLPLLTPTTYADSSDIETSEAQADQVVYDKLRKRWYDIKDTGTLDEPRVISLNNGTFGHVKQEEVFVNRVQDIGSIYSYPGQMITVNSRLIYGDSMRGERYIVLTAGVESIPTVVETANGLFATRIPRYFPNGGTRFVGQNMDAVLKQVDTLKSTTFSNKAAVLAYGNVRVKVGDVIRTEGYLKRNDGGGAYYKIQSTFPTGLPASNTGVITLGGSKYAVLMPQNGVLRAESFGVRPADSTLALNNDDLVGHALDFAKHVTGGLDILFGEGEFYFKDPIIRDVGFNNITIRGLGPFRTILQFRRSIDHSNKTLLQMRDNKNVTIKDATFAVDTFVPACLNCGGEAEDVNFGTIIDLGGTDSVLITNTRLIFSPEPVVGASMGAILMTGNVRHVTINRNYIRFGQMKIGREGSHNIIISNNYSFRPYNQGLSIVNPNTTDTGPIIYENILIEGNTFIDNPSAAAIFFGGDGEGAYPVDTSRHVYIRNNIVIGSEFGAGSAMSFFWGENTYDIEVSGNRIYNTSAYNPVGLEGMQMREPTLCSTIDSISCYADDVRVFNNTIHRTDSYGFRIVFPNPHKTSIYGKNGKFVFSGNALEEVREVHLSIPKFMDGQAIIENNYFHGDSYLNFNVADTTSFSIKNNQFIGPGPSGGYAILLTQNRRVGRYSWMRNSEITDNHIESERTTGIEYAQGTNYNADSSIFDLRISDKNNMAITGITGFPTGKLRQRYVRGERRDNTFRNYYIGDDVHADSSLAITNRWKEHSLRIQLTNTTNNGARVTLGKFDVANYNFDWVFEVTISVQQQATNVRKYIVEKVIYSIRQELNSSTSPIMTKAIPFYHSLFTDSGTYIHLNTSSLTNTSGTLSFDINGLGDLGPSGETATKLNVTIKIYSTHSGLTSPATNDFLNLEPTIANVTHALTTANRDHQQTSPGTASYATHTVAKADANLISTSNYRLDNDPLLYSNLSTASDTLSKTQSIHHRIVSASVNNSDVSPSFVNMQGRTYTIETTSGASSNSDITLPTPTANLLGKTVSVRGLDDHATHNNQIISSSIIDQYGTTHTTYVMEDDEQVNMFVGQDPSASTYHWYLTTTVQREMYLEAYIDSGDPDTLDFAASPTYVGDITLGDATSHWAQTTDSTFTYTGKTMRVRASAFASGDITTSANDNLFLYIYRNSTPSVPVPIVNFLLNVQNQIVMSEIFTINSGDVLSVRMQSSNPLTGFVLRGLSLTLFKL